MAEDEQKKPTNRRRTVRVKGSKTGTTGVSQRVGPRTKTPVRSIKRSVATAGDRTAPGRKPGTGKRPVRVTRSKVRPRRITKMPDDEKDDAQSLDLGWMEEDPKDHLLSRFIEDPSSNIIGESIGIERKNLIMKSGLKFYSIPLKNIVEKNDNLSIKGRIDRKKARKLGEAWRKRALDPLYQKKNKK